MISLTVQLEVHEEHLDAFLDAITENAERTFTDEPGCLRFDVCQVSDQPLRFVFYEIYTSHEALAAHRSAPHFAVWRRAADAYVVPGTQINTVSELRISHTQNAKEVPQ